jgi:hypothetical protein
VADARLVSSLVVAGALLAQAAFTAQVPHDWAAHRAIGAPPDARVVTVASLGETHGAASALTLVLQSFDTQAGQQQSLRALDHGDTIAWLARIGELAPQSGYDVFLATRLYVDLVPRAAVGPLLDWVHARFLQAPDENWVSMTHAVHLARYRLDDPALAVRYAQSLRERAGPQVPGWATQMEVLLRAELGETEAARVLYGALFESGALADPREQQVLAERLDEAERRHSADGRPAADTGRGR